MAFHPFQSFRKRQKTLLAILTIVSMFIFILTGYVGGIMDWVNKADPQRMGYTFIGLAVFFALIALYLIFTYGMDQAVFIVLSALCSVGLGIVAVIILFRTPTNPVVPLYGKVVTESDLSKLRLDRRRANSFMTQAILATQPTVSDEDRAEVSAHLEQLRRQNFMAGPDELKSLIVAYRQELLKANKTAAAGFLLHMVRVFEILSWWPQTHPGQVYFGGGLGPDDLLDFLVWKKQADKLDITLNDEDLRKAINAEADGDVLTGDTAKDAEKVGLYLGKQYGTNDPKIVLEALRDEFRVRLAKEILLGSAGSTRSAVGGSLANRQVPGEGTPQEFWDYFKDNQTKLKVAFLKVPVQQFTGEVKKEPTQQELEELFRRGKNDEPTPDRPTFGFKQPRRVKVEWVAADPDAPHYRETAEKALPSLKASGPLSLLSFPGVSGGTAAGAAGPAAQMAAGSLWNVPQQFTYMQYVKGVKSWWDATSVTPQGNNPWTTGLNRPETVASVTGQMLGSGLTGGTPWCAEGALFGSLDIRQAELKVRQASMVLAGASPFPLSVAAQEAALSDVRVPRFSEAEADLALSLSEGLAAPLADEALNDFLKGLDAKRYNPQEAVEYVKQHANVEHGITAHGAMTEPRDELTIADAPALAALRAAKEGAAPSTPSSRRDFAEQFFTTFDMRTGQAIPTQPYQPQRLSDLRGKTIYYWWLTESEKPRLRTFNEAKADVEAAWKLIQARTLARQTADQVVEQVQKRGQGISADSLLRDEAARLAAAHPDGGDKEFELIGISRLTPQMQPFLGPKRYGPYRFPEADITYPRADTVDELLSKLQKTGDALVFADRPERNYFVAVLQDRAVPKEKDFYEIYEHAPYGPVTDTLYTRFQSEREQKYRAAVVRHLREDAKAPLDDQGNYKIDPEVRKRIGTGTGTGEE